MPIEEELRVEEGAKVIPMEKDKGLSTLYIDAGSSSTKVFSFRSNKYSNIANNVFLDVPEDLNTFDIIGKKALIEDSLDITIDKLSGKTDEALDKFLGKRIICGKLASMVSPFTSRLSPFYPKYEQPEFYINILTAILIELLKGKVGTGRDDVKVALLLPPYEHYHNKLEAINNLVGTYRIQHNFIGCVSEFEIKKQNVMILPESFTSFANICYTNTGAKTSAGESFVNKTVICIDIGKNTTDISGMYNLAPLSYTFETFRFGTDQMVSSLTNLISQQEGTRFNKKAYEDAFITGRLEDGDSFKNVRGLVSAAREEFAGKFIQQFAEYLDTKNLQFRNIAGLVFIGGGSIGTEQCTSAAQRILAYANRFSPNTKGIFVDDPRRSNLEGLVNLVRNQMNK